MKFQGIKNSYSEGGNKSRSNEQNGLTLYRKIACKQSTLNNVSPNNSTGMVNLNKNLKEKTL